MLFISQQKLYKSDIQVTESAVLVVFSHRISINDSVGFKLSSILAV